MLHGFFYYFLGPAAFGGRALAGLAGLLGPAGFALGLPLRGPLSGP